MFKKIFMLTTALIAAGLGLWYTFIALKPVPVDQSEIVPIYDYPAIDLSSVSLTKVESNTYAISYRSFDGSLVNGQISYPESCAQSCPVVVGISAMGRNYNRWWIDSWKDRPTVTNVNKIGSAALSNDSALVAIDARYHGSRKDPNKTLRSIMNDMNLFGDKSSYEAMIIDTAKDYRILLDWIEANDRLDNKNITVAGYSMGGQLSLLIGSLDPRVSKIISIVPPYLDDKVARVAPKNLISKIGREVDVLLLTSDDDENATVEQNRELYDAIPSGNKKHLVYEGSHILPSSYVDDLMQWLTTDEGSLN